MKTLTDLEALTDDELRVMLALLMGWKQVHIKTAVTDVLLPPDGLNGKAASYRKTLMLYEDDFETAICHLPNGLLPHLRDGETLAEMWDRHGLPNYPKDLNACHEVDTQLTLDQSTQYVNLLWPQGYAPFQAVTASPRQRTIALILILQKP